MSTGPASEGMANVANTRGSVTSDGHVFLSYVREDAAVVDWLQARLERAGIPVWRDINGLWPGDIWKRRLQEAIQDQSLVYLPCFSSNLSRRRRSTMYTELSWAADEYRRRPPDVPWIIPLRLDTCSLPSYDLGAGLSFGDLQWVDLAGGARDREVERLITVLHRSLGQPGWYYERDKHLTPYGQAGRALGAEFIGDTLDLIVWDEFHDHGTRCPALLHHADSYRSVRGLTGIPPANRIRDVGAGFVAVNGDHALSVYDLRRESVVAELRADNRDPIIHTEVVHPHRSEIAIGTHYGLVVVWNWREDRELFRRRYFPHEQSVWINGLAIDVARNLLWIGASGQVFAVSARTGDPIPDLVTAINQEVGAIAYSEAAGMLAVGCVMETHVFRISDAPVLRLTHVEHDYPLARQVSFSPDGSVLAIHAGGLGPSAVTFYETRQFAKLGDPITDEYGQQAPLISRKTGVSFASDSSMVSVAQGDRIGLYARRGPTPD